MYFFRQGIFLIGNLKAFREQPKTDNTEQQVERNSVTTEMTENDIIEQGNLALH